MLSSAFVAAVLLTVLAQRGSFFGYDQKLVNNVGDFILKNLKIFNPSSFSMKNKTRSFASASVEIETNLGSINDFKTLKRAGDIGLEFSEGSVTVNFKFRLATLKVLFNEYKLKIFGMVTSEGVLEVSVMDNLMEISVDMGEKSLCFLTINRLDILELDGVDVHFYEHGSKQLSYWKSAILNPIVHMFESNIKEKVQKKMRKVLPKIIKPNKYLCNDNVDEEVDVKNLV